MKINKDSSPINDDTDNDGVPNYLDANDDGDNKLTITEGATKDTDNDGILDYLDKHDGVKDSYQLSVKKQNIPDKPEVVVLFDGDLESLKDKPENNSKKDTENNDTSEAVIDETLKNVVLDSNKEKQEQKLNTSTKEKKGFISWITSLLPD